MDIGRKPVRVHLFFCSIRKEVHVYFIFFILILDLVASPSSSDTNILWAIQCSPQHANCANIPYVHIVYCHLAG